MTATALDTITAAFVGALQAGTGALAAFSLPLLGVFAIIAFYVHMGPLVASGSVNSGDALASVLLLAVKMGIFYWLLIYLAPIATAAMETFLQWGMAAASTPISSATMMQPSTIIDLGFKAVLPIQQLISRSAGWSNVWNYSNYFIYTVAKLAVLIAFFLVGLHLM